MLAVGEFVAVLTPGASLPTGTRLLVLWIPVWQSPESAQRLSSRPLWPCSPPERITRTTGRVLSRYGRPRCRLATAPPPILGGLAARSAIRLRPAGRVAVGVPRRDGRRADQRARVGHGCRGLVLSGRPVTGLAGPDHDCRGTVRPALFRHPGADGRVAKLAGHRRVHRRRCLPHALCDRGAKVRGPAAAAGFLPQPEFRA